MGKRRSKKAAGSNGIDYETDESAVSQQQQKLIPKAEMEQKATRILKLMKNKDQWKKGGMSRDSKKDSDVVGLVEDLYRNYESIYEQYDHLREERIVNCKKEKEKEREDTSSPSASTSSYYSDSEYFSSEEMELAHSNLQNEQARNLHLHQKSELENQFVQRNQAFAEVDSLRRELDYARNQKCELENSQNKERSENMILIRNLKEELLEKTRAEKAMLKEKERHLVWIKELEVEVNTLLHSKSELEEQNNRMRSENHRLNTRNSELELSLTSKENEASQTIALMEQVKNLQQNLDSLQVEKNRLGQENEGDKEEFSRRLSGIEIENNKLKSKIDDQERILKEKDEALASLIKKFNQAKESLPDMASILINAERKMEESSDELRSCLEDKIRLLSRRIFVAEQLHTESREHYRARNRKHEQEKRQLEQKIANYETELVKLCNMNEFGIDLMVSKFEEESVELLNHISRITKEFTLAKHWAKTRNIEIKQLKSELTHCAAQVAEKEEQEFLLRQKLWNLEAKISKEGGDKLNLISTLGQFEKKMEKILQEKDAELSKLAEEKRAAIRQLCIMIEHHRSRYENLHEAIFGKFRNRRRN